MRGLLVFLIALPALLAACAAPECAFGDYGRAECRVAAENHYARMITGAGVEFRFQAPDAVSPDSWEALGLVEQLPDGAVRLRPATIGAWAISIDPGTRGATEVEVILDNVPEDTLVTLGPTGAEEELRTLVQPGIVRTLRIELGPDTLWLRGTRACPDRYRIAAAGDIQTNPLQFERIVEDLLLEVERGEAAGEPLLGFLLLGDLAEEPADPEFDAISAILARSPVPVSTVPGNHDIAGDVFGAYNRAFGPGNYAYNVCRTRVALVDSAGGDMALSVEARLPQLLDPDEMDYLVAGTHYPAYAERTAAGWGDEDQAWYLLSELARNEADVLLAGHVHYWVDLPGIAVGDGTVDEIITGTAGGSQGSGLPHFGYTRLTFGDDAMTTCFHEVPELGRSPGDRGASVRTIRYCED